MASHRTATQGVVRVARVTLMSVIFFPGCAGDSPAGAGESYTVRDSAGIEIVENHDSLWTTETAWYVDPEPVVDIGHVEGEGYRFGQATQPVRLSDGQLVVGDRTDNQILYFNRAGELLRAVGGRGDGPGEIRYFGAIEALDGDTVAILDQSGRTEYFDAEGDHLRSEGPSLWEGLSSFPMAMGPRGHRVMRGRPRRPEPIPTTIRHDSASIGLFGREKEPIVDLGVFPVTSVALVPGESYLRLPELRSWLFADVGHERVYLGFSEQFSISVFTVDGNPLRIIRIPRVGRPIDEALIREFAEVRARTPLPGFNRMPEPGEVASVRRVVLEAPYPETLPVHSTIRVDETGHLWVRDWVISRDQLGHGLAWEGNPSAWTVLDPDGRWLGTVELPGEVLINQIGPDYVLGLHANEYDVRHPVMYRLVKPGG